MSRGFTEISSSVKAQSRPSLTDCASVANARPINRWHELSTYFAAICYFAAFTTSGSVIVNVIAVASTVAATALLASVTFGADPIQPWTSTLIGL